MIFYTNIGYSQRLRAPTLKLQRQRAEAKANEDKRFQGFMKLLFKMIYRQNNIMGDIPFILGGIFIMVYRKDKGCGTRKCR